MAHASTNNSRSDEFNPNSTWLASSSMRSANDDLVSPSGSSETSTSAATTVRQASGQYDSRHSVDSLTEETLATTSSPVPIRALSTSAQGDSALSSRSNNISFSPLPIARSPSETQQPRRQHEFTPSPARSLALVLENAAAAEATRGLDGQGSQGDGSNFRSSPDQWGAHTSGHAGSSTVHFQPRSHPQGYRSTRPGSGAGSAAWMGTSIPESRFSEFEVVYDDGIRKQRTFSLTTDLDDEEDDRSYSDDDDDGSETSPLIEYQEAPPPQEHIQGPHGYTGHLPPGASHSPLLFPPSHPSSHPTQSTPLLAKQHLYHNTSSINAGRHYSVPPRHGSTDGANPFAYLFHSVYAAWHLLSQQKISTPNRRILKASLAYFCACLVSFTPFFKPYIGLSGHLAASAAIFFNPAKTLGRMVDAITAGLCAISFGFLVCVASAASATWFNSQDQYILGHVVSVVVFGGGSTFIIAYAKAHYNRPTVNGACTLSHIMIIVTLTKEGALTFAKFNLTRVFAITTSMLLGVAITTLVCVLLWPESAHEDLRQAMGKSLSSFRLLLKLLTKTFLLEADTTPFGSESVQKLIESQVSSFSALAMTLEEAQLEFAGADIKKYEDCVKSLNTLAQYLNGLRSSCGLQYDMLKKDEMRRDGEARRQRTTTTAPPMNTTGIRPEAGQGPKRPLGFGMRMSSYSLLGGLNSDQDQSASADLIEFLDHVGKPMKSLALTCKLTIEHLQDIFNSTDVERAPSVGRNQTNRSRASHPYPNHSNQRQGGYESSAEVFSDSTYDAGTSHTSNHPASSHESFKKNPGLVLMQFNLAKALDIFENANSRALKKFYSHQNKRRSGTFKRPQGVTKRLSEPSFHGAGIGIGSLEGEPGAEPATASEATQDVLGEKAPVGEQIFLVYFFVFNLMEFSKELSNLVSCVEILVNGDEGLPLWIARNRQNWWRRIWFNLTGFPRSLRKPIFDTEAFDNFDAEQQGYPPNSHHSYQSQTPISRSASDHQQPHASSGGHNSTNNNSLSERRRRKQKQRLFPKPNIHNTSNTLQTPTPSTFVQRWSTRIWKFLHRFRSFQVKYAAKTAFSAMIMLVPAFVDWTRPYFVQYRGEWAIISMLVVMVPTVGGTNIVGVYRIISTIIGCYMGVVVYVLFPAHDVMLPICCFLFAVPNFYLVLCSSYPRLGQVTLLAFSLVLIQTYNRRHGDGTVPPDEDEDDDDDDYSGPFSPSKVLRTVGSLLSDHASSDPGPGAEVWAIAFHRAVAVSLGVVVGVAVTSYVWPYEARVELRKGLSDLLLNISWLYNRLVSVYSTNLDRVSILPREDHYQKARSRFREMLRKTSFQHRFQTPAEEQRQQQQQEEDDNNGEMDIERMNKEFMAIELSLQLQLLQLYALLEETPNEPRMKGKFPVETYKNMLGSCQNILDRFLSMRLVITKDEWLESARRDFIVPVNKERREMVGNVLLYFYTIASAMRLKTPLPPYLPPANNARLRLIQKIRQLPVVQNKVVMTEDNDERYIFYYAYALVMDDVIRELERLGRWSQDLFGVITPAAEFEAWFTDDGMIAPSSSSSTSTAAMTLGLGSSSTSGSRLLPSSATREAPMSPYTDVEQPYQYPTVHTPTSSHSANAAIGARDGVRP
ncbi:hypothetical protein BGZ75_005308 [Mortierella antarctica]|nr:hypothetical protein BGZ75_005308 [Mortierella antarctica]